MYFLLALLLIVVVIFGIASGMQSYASARQAQATIEVAKVAQVNAWGNLVTIMTLALVILVVVAVIIFFLYRFALQSKIHHNVQTSGKRLRETDSAPEIDPNAAIGQLVQLETLRLLSDMRPSQPKGLLQAPKEEQPVDEPFHWLR